MSDTSVTKSIRRDVGGEAAIPKGGKLIPVIIDLDWAALKPHPFAAQFPMADKFNQEKLKQSIKLHGIKADEPVVLRRRNGELELGDGRNRHFCGNEVKHPWAKADFREFVGTDAEFEAFVRERNTRRHMTAEEREKHVEWLLDQYPHLGSRKLAEMALCSHTKIAEMRKARKEKEEEKLRGERE